MLSVAARFTFNFVEGPSANIASGSGGRAILNPFLATVYTKEKRKKRLRQRLFGYVCKDGEEKEPVATFVVCYFLQKTV